MPTITLSELALALLRRRLTGESVKASNETRPLYRELVEARLMIPLHSFARGAEGTYRFTEAACNLRDAGEKVPEGRMRG